MLLVHWSAGIKVIKIKVCVASPMCWRLVGNHHDQPTKTSSPHLPLLSLEGPFWVVGISSGQFAVKFTRCVGAFSRWHPLKIKSPPLRTFFFGPPVAGGGFQELSRFCTEAKIPADRNSSIRPWSLTAHPGKIMIWNVWFGQAFPFGSLSACFQGSNS